jgi:hypothetical protein
MHLRVYDSRDSSRQPAPSPSLCYSLTHAHRSIGYHNRNPQPLVDSVVRLMYLRVYDSRDISHQPPPSPSPCYPLTHAHRSIGYRNRNPQSLDVSTVRLMYLLVYDSRDRLSGTSGLASNPANRQIASSSGASANIHSHLDLKSLSFSTESTNVLLPTP